MTAVTTSTDHLMDESSAVSGSLLDIAGEQYYCVSNHDEIAPFFMSLVSDSDHWLFISSNGSLTAGRKDPDHALFPYYTDDRIHDGQDQTGSTTILRISRGGRTQLWEPFSQRMEGLYAVTRNLCKSVYGNKILFEEINHDLAMTFRYEWMNSERFGFVRRATLVNHGQLPATAELVDGIQNVLPWGVERRFQAEYSTLADGYKRTELLEGTRLALFRLSSVPVDKTEPSEALRVNLAWSTGLEPALRLLSTAQFRDFRKGRPLHEERDVRGQRGAYLLGANLNLGPGEQKDWLIVAEVDQDAAAVVALSRHLASGADLKAEVLEDVAWGTQNLLRIVASADGLQATGDQLNACRHFSNTLFNVLRGGLPSDGYRITRSDLRLFLDQSNRGVARRHRHFVDELPETMLHDELMERVASMGDPDLERLAMEYLPLTFSRRHGDPSRPWNNFSIQLKDDAGRKSLNYEGNWRDIFQNWEALGYSFPGYLESMIFKFADCSTVDGFNPYRLMRVGFDWEVSDPQDPWSFIGYWGDHQVIYLLKLLEASCQFHPGRLASLLERQVFTYANVPYRIKPYQAMLGNPHNTIEFDETIHRQAQDLAATMGADGLLVMGPQAPVRANLTDKLLLVALSKLVNYIPEAGIWMNTQRPEWNDANNALVGHGVSMVTLYYLRRYLAFCQNFFSEAASKALEVAGEISKLLEQVAEALVANAMLTDRAVTNLERKVVLDLLGQAGSDYRTKVYATGFSEARVRIPVRRLQAFCGIALQHIDRSIRVNRRSDGLYHAYNVMKVVGDGIEIRNLYEMLEGQVAVLSSGVLSGEESVAVLDALRASALYRADQAGYLLYPDHPLPHFLEKNTFPPDAVAGSALLTALAEAGDTRLAARDVEGQFHFNAAFRNAGALKQALNAMKDGPYRALVEAEEPRLLDLYEKVFDHQSFTGRSGTFYKYEGLGCIYWHMVSKLLLAVDETRHRTAGGDPAVLARMGEHYQAIREGLGVHKSPALHGAIPTDPYSHTTGFAGAQQPGMTGQVKEDILTRLSEMGIHIEGGRIVFQPWLVPATEFLRHGTSFQFIDLENRISRIDLEPGSFAFTFCQVPVVTHRAGGQGIQVTRQDGSSTAFDTLTLDASTSGAIFNRTGEVQRIDVFLEA
jgi:hypothetical protein